MAIAKEGYHYGEDKVELVAESYQSYLNGDKGRVVKFLRDDPEADWPPGAMFMSADDMLSLMNKAHGENITSSQFGAMLQAITDSGLVISNPSRLGSQVHEMSTGDLLAEIRSR